MIVATKADYGPGRGRRNLFIRQIVSGAGQSAVEPSALANEFEDSLAVAVQLCLSDAGDASQFPGRIRPALGNRQQGGIGQHDESRLPLLLCLTRPPFAQPRQQTWVGVRRAAGAPAECNRHSAGERSTALPAASSRPCAPGPLPTCGSFLCLRSDALEK